LAVSFFYLLAQMAGAGGLVALLLDIHGRLAQSVVIAVVAASSDFFVVGLVAIGSPTYLPSMSTLRSAPRRGQGPRS